MGARNAPICHKERKMKSIRLKSYAKVNLALDVTGILENGYHELNMVMQQLDLHDDVLVRWIPGGEGIDIELKTNRSYLPTDERNLAYKGAMVMAERFGNGRNGTIRIDIGKNIPVAAGLAGGSGNGGALILALDSLWNLGLSLTEMMELGKLLGSDVPFTMMGMASCNEELPEHVRNDKMASSAAVATYDGTVLTPVRPLDAYVVLSKPPISVSTKEVYQAIDDVDIPERPDVKDIVVALEEQNTTIVAQKMLNVLEFYTAFKYNFIMDTISMARQCEGSLGAIMSGSGPTVFSIMESEKSAAKAAEKLMKINKETYLTHTTA